MWKRIVGYTLLTIVCVAGAGFAYLYFRKPASAPPRNVKVAMTPERIARGKYLFNLADCDGCHSPHEDDKLYMPVIESRRGSGRTIPEGSEPFVTPNITPDPDSGIGSWTDGEKIRAIREGIAKDGRALFPMMPYQLYRYMSDEDVESLVAYMNSLAPQKASSPPSQILFPMNMLIKGAPQPVLKPVKTPDRSNPVVYGEYLATLGVCEGCHTPFEKGSFDMSKRLAGGRVFQFGEYRVVTPNLTPDKDTGIGNWSADYWRERFYRFRQHDGKALGAVTKEQFTIMPWLGLAQLPPEDLDAMYAYLMSRPPVSHKVNVHPEQVARR
jgi:mono/diheme cytochrome c family protein